LVLVASAYTTAWYGLNNAKKYVIILIYVTINCHKISCFNTKMPTCKREYLMIDVKANNRTFQATLFHPISLKSMLMFLHLHPDLPNGLFPSSFLTKIVYTFLVPSMCATCPAHPPYDHPNTVEEYKL
jgi:hypothetical protein